jgi:hypothetical protein
MVKSSEESDYLMDATLESAPRFLSLAAVPDMHVEQSQVIYLEFY